MTAQATLPTLDELPPPPVPSDADLRSYPKMFLDVHRLLNSDLMLLDPHTVKIALQSWCVSWHQLPAGSLPDDDRQLARLLGLGNPANVRRMREAGRLRGWERHSDGRLYHAVVAETVNEALATNAAQRRRTEAATAARRRKAAPPVDNAKVIPSLWEAKTAEPAQARPASPPASRGASPPPSPPASPPAWGGAETTQPIDFTRSEINVTSSNREGYRERDSTESSTGTPRGTAPWMPTLQDPEPRWSHLCDSHEIDERGLVPTSKGLRGGYFLRDTALLVAEAAGWRHGTFSTDWTVLCQWLDERIDPHDVIIPTLRRIRKQRPGQDIGSLRYFDQAVRRAVELHRVSA